MNRDTRALVACPDAVRSVTKGQAAGPIIFDGVTADSLNSHGTSIFTDLTYVEPVLKTHVTRLECVVTEEMIFN